ncbi:hypothetical protein FA95DRAFT_1679505 [Auriscalpium vulgare]|uniref:Uncharacterized protein n=1 Tax=Auriscalpium vulgare TaxID=40419 RepID=A0ACB8RTC5_9AGAM|nr:hypothetical protein FA95DRAFT_1679505 [Auriscalpium vulgare]
MGSVSVPTPPLSVSSSAPASSTSSEETSSSVPTSSTPPPTTSSTPSSTSSTPSSTSTSSSSDSSTLSSSSSTESISSTSLPPSSAPPSSTTVVSSSQHLTTSGGHIFTQTATSVITVGDPTPTAASRSSSSGFFHNTGAVAGVFTVVGLIALVLAVILGTNVIRRRRARKFDKEIDEAAAAAAAGSHAPDFDDYDYGSSNAPYGPYSDGSHGTFAQPPLSHNAVPEQYDMPSYDPYTTAGVGTAGAAGIGAGVGAMQRARSQLNQQDPYGAFAEPEQYEMQDSQLRYRRSTGPSAPAPYDLLEAAGIAGASDGPYAVARGPSQRGAPGLARNPSNPNPPVALSSESHYSGSQPGYGQPQAWNAAAPPPVPPSMPQPQPYEEDAYGGYLDEPSPDLANPYSPGMPAPAHSQSHTPSDEGVHPPYVVDQNDSRASLRDEEDYGYDGGRRVLRVANE